MDASVYSTFRVKNILEKNSLTPKKRFGQNFLTDYNIASKIADTKVDNRSEAVLEIGGGLGALSRCLEERYKQVFCVEYDAGLYRYLDSALPSVSVFHEDILSFKLSKIGENNFPVDVYGNIPYSISSPIVRWLLVDNAGRWKQAVFLVQTDFAKRLCASVSDKDYSALSLNISYFASVKIEFSVSSSVFYPKPKVGSSVVSFKPKLYADIKHFDSFSKTVVAIFGNRRKTVRSNLTRVFNIEKECVYDILRESGISETARGEELDIDSVYKLSRNIDYIAKRDI